jgi:hypothetical protein
VLKVPASNQYISMLDISRPKTMLEAGLVVKERRQKQMDNMLCNHYEPLLEYLPVFSR